MKRRAVLILLTLSLLVSAVPAAASILWTDVLGGPLIPRNTVVRYQSEGIPYYVYLPSSAQLSKPLTPLLAIHAYGEDAQGFVQRMVPEANRYGWLLVAPDLPSGDWKDYRVIQRDARINLPWLHRLVHSLTGLLGVPVEERVLVYGFSLGAQTGHRFTLAYPEHVKAAAIMAAGTYTLPLETSPRSGDPLLFPLGTSDLDHYGGQPLKPDLLRTTRFWVAVGEADAAPSDVPREFDAAEGECRRDRALNFALTLTGQGVPAEFRIFPGQAHYETRESLDAATAFLFKASAGQ